jgi:hypothetical protein
MLFVFSAFAFFIQMRSEQNAKVLRVQEIASVASSLHTEIANAQRVEDGYVRVFELPRMINGETYTITLVGKSEVILRAPELEYILFLPANITIVDEFGTAQTQMRTGKNVIVKNRNSIVLRLRVQEVNTCEFIRLPASTTTYSWVGCNMQDGTNVTGSCVKPGNFVNGLVRCDLPNVKYESGKIVSWSDNSTPSCTPLQTSSVLDGFNKTIQFYCP